MWLGERGGKVGGRRDHPQYRQTPHPSLSPQRMPPIYELSSPFFYHTQKDSAQLVKQVGGKILDINVDNGEAGLYFAVR